ncbi:cilia- and flagella-associated protein 57-like [Perca flavescens]|uniref:cilia- and flagella-associated protein 57-like n=1 Tax=Perca flavescens TaxID=8167 RepID=UPI00106EFE21|nr:cilia- and flagella-associated protein 57-like [Perca flavescens]
MALQDSNVKFLQFRIEELKSKVRKQELHFTKLSQTNFIQRDSLETKVKALVKELKTHKDKAEEWKSQLRLSQDEVKNLSLDKAELMETFQGLRAKHTQSESELRQQKRDSETNAKNTVKELTANHESEISRMRAEHDGRLAEVEATCQQQTEQLRIAEEQAEKQDAELKELRATLPRVETEYKDRVEDLRKQLQERDKVIATENILKKDTRLNELVKQKELEMHIEKLKKTIRGLKNKEDLSEKVSALESTIQDRQNVIGKKNLEMSRLMKDNKQLQQDWAKEKDNNAVLLVKLNEVKDNLNGIEDDLRTTQWELKEAMEKLYKTLRENADLGETISHLNYKVRKCEPDLIKEREKNRNLLTYVMRFKADLQACMDFTSEPKTFVHKVFDVKRHYIDNNTNVQMDGNTETGLRKAIAAKDQLINSCRRCYQNSSRAQETLPRFVFSERVRSNQDQSSLIRVINDMTVELHHLKAELKDTTLILEMAKRPRLQQVKSWIKRNVLQTLKVASNDAEEPPSRLPGDDTAPSARPCADDTTSSSSPPSPSSPPHPYTEDGIIHVKPFVERDLPTVDV